MAPCFRLNRAFLTVIVVLLPVVLMILLGVLDVDVSRSFVMNRDSRRPAIPRKSEEPGKHRIVIIGAGPTALGAALRLHDLGQENNNTVVTILEELGKPGGLASSERDDQGFLWDSGIHVLSSHYAYFDQILERAGSEWSRRPISSFAFMKGSDEMRRFIPYPVQNNIHAMGVEDQERILAGLEDIAKHPITEKPKNFEEWLVQKFGVGLCDVFMRKYYMKFWTADTRKLSWGWVGEPVTTPSIDEIKSKIKEANDGILVKDSGKGPDSFFRVPKLNGTGGIWEAVARLIPSHWFRFHDKVVGIDTDKKIVTVETGRDAASKHTVAYDTLISTIPLDIFTKLLRSSDSSLQQMQESASQLVFTQTHIVGLGLRGQPPKNLADKALLYFPDTDSLFYQMTVFYADDHVPKAGAYWSLLCEIAQPRDSWNPSQWIEINLIGETIQALVSYGFITADMVVSKYYRRLDQGYPVPSLKRDTILDSIQPWLESKDIYSRGRFGGWKYEVGNQDHSFMQGVEVVDKIVRGVPEKAYPHPDLNSKKTMDKIVRGVPEKTYPHPDLNSEKRFRPLNYEFVISHYNEDLNWLKPFANHAHVYHKGKDTHAPFKLYAWERLPNVGRESHTYLHHIITNYDHLSEVTIFLQGGIRNHGTCRPKDPLSFVSLAKRGIPCGKDRNTWKNMGRIPFRKDFQKIPKYADFVRANVTYGEFYKDLMGSEPPARGVEFCFSGCFAATKAMIRKHPLEFYKKAISYVNSHSSQEESHYFERLWYVMFKT